MGKTLVEVYRTIEKRSYKEAYKDFYKKLTKLSDGKGIPLTHITPYKNLETIKRNGLKPDYGNVSGYGVYALIGHIKDTKWANLGSEGHEDFVLIYFYYPLKYIESIYPDPNVFETTEEDEYERPYVEFAELLNEYPNLVGAEVLLNVGYESIRLDKNTKFEKVKVK